MANYDLSFPGAAIDAILTTAYDLQNAGYIFKGSAYDYTGTPTERTWLIAGEGFTGFGFTTAVPKGCIGLCLYNGSTWSGKVVRVVTIDVAPTSGSTNAVQSGAVYSMVNTVAIGISNALNSLTFQETTVSGDEGIKLVESLLMTSQGVTDILTSFTILAATTSKAGLLSASDKAKLDAILTNIRSMVVTETTLTPNQGTELTESLKWTVGGVQEVISAFTILAATTSKAGLMSAEDKTKLNTLFADGYKFAGIAVPSTVPMSTSAKIFYIATQAGTYTRFDGIELTDGINVLMYNGSSWSSSMILETEASPVSGSHKFVESAGIYREDEIIRDKIEGITLLQPFATVDGKFIDSSGNESSNQNFRYMKFDVQPKHRYLVSSKIFSDNITLWTISWYDENGVFIDHDCHLTSTSKEFYNEPINSPSQAKYAYMNVSIGTQPAFMFMDYPATLPQVEDMLTKKAFGIWKVSTINNTYFNRSNGLSAIGSVFVAKFAVTPNTKYRFKMSIPAGTNLSMYLINFFNSNNEFISGVSPSYRCTNDAAEFDTEIATSATCSYIYVNVPRAAMDSFFLGYADVSVIKDEDEEIQAEYITNTPYEVVEGKYVGEPDSGQTVPSEKTLASMKYSKYTLDADKKYSIDYTIGGSVTVYMVYFVDSNGDYISRTLRNQTGSVVNGSMPLTVPTNAAGVYINESVSGATWITLKEVSTADRTADILDFLSKNKVCRLGAGDYYINALDMPDGTTLQGDGKSTRLIMSGTSDGYAIRVGARCTIKDLWIDGGAPLEYKGEENMSIDEIHMTGNRHGILLLGDGENSNWSGTVVQGCEITNFNGGGITCDNTGYGTYSSLTVSDCWIRNCCVGINIAYFSEFNKFVNVGCWGCRYGCVNNGGNNTFSNCGFNSNQIGFYMNGNDGKCIRYNGTTIDGRNMGHGVMANCILDHNGKDNSDVGYAIVVMAISPGYQFSNLSIHYGKMYFANSNNISFSNGKIGLLTSWEIRNMVSPMVISDFVGSSSSFTPFAIYLNDTLITDFDADGNGGYVYMRDCFRYRTRATPQYLMSL